MSKRIVRTHERMNESGQEVYTKVDPDTGEIIPPLPRAVEIPFQTRQRSLQELLAATSRDFSDWDEGEDGDDYELEDDAFDVDDPSYNPLGTESTPHSEGFVDTHGMSLTKAIEIVKRSNQWAKRGSAIKSSHSQQNNDSEPEVPAEGGSVL